MKNATVFQSEVSKGKLNKITPEIYKSIKDELNSKFIQMDNFIDSLLDSWVTYNGKNTLNVFGYGPGGNGKSDIAIVYAKLMKKYNLISSFIVISGNPAMTEDKLHGGINLGKYKKDSLLRWNLHNSYANHDIAIVDEAFDMQIDAIASMKASTSDGVIYDGQDEFKTKTKQFIFLSNRTPSYVKEFGDWAEALLQRMPFMVEVRWRSFTSNDYKKLLKIKGYEGQVYDILADCCAIINNHGIDPNKVVPSAASKVKAPVQKVQPRMALYAARAISKKLEFNPNSNPFTVLKNFDGFSKDYNTILNYFDSNINLEEEATKLEMLTMDFKNKIKACEDLEKLEALMAKITKYFETTPVKDSMQKMYNKQFQELLNTSEDRSKELANADLDPFGF